MHYILTQDGKNYGPIKTNRNTILIISEVNTKPSVPKYKAYKFSQKSNPTKFGQIFTEKYKHLEY
jgi:hypothetical protein